jgi:hypothetical protein
MGKGERKMIANIEPVSLIELARPTEFRVGYPHQKLEDRTFIIQVDARPLAKLFQDAARGQRVYELMSIERPGDILHYLWLTVPDRESGLAKATTERHASQFRYRGPMGDVCHMPFTEFDTGFIFDGDDTDDVFFMWDDFKESQEWRPYPFRLLSVAKSAQEKLRNSSDYLVQYELALMQQRMHRQDFWSSIRRYCEMEFKSPAIETAPAEVFDCIVRLAQQPNVNSVSCPFQDFDLWRTLIAEQVRRSTARGVAPQEALQLNGPDSGIPYIRGSNYYQDRDWGGEVHIPYEGATGGDLFIQPKWFGFSAELARKAPTLSHAVFGQYAVDGFKTCKYLLTRLSALGELPCATRTIVGEWVMYTAREDQLHASTLDVKVAP